MEYQKKYIYIDNTPNQPSNFWTKDWVKINDDVRGTCNTDSQIKFKTLTLKSSLYDYSDTCKLVKGTISISPVPTPAANPNNNDKEVVL